MPKKRKLTPPDWRALTGGSGADKWQEDRLRKFGRIKLTAPVIAQWQDNLGAEGALYRCSRSVLRKHPSAGQWYVSLACFAGKTLTNLQERAKTEFKLSVLPETFLENMRIRPQSVPDSDLDAFSEWINSELAELIGDRLEGDRLAGLHVAMIAGGRIIGQGQNEGGELAVAILKEGLLEHCGPAAEWKYRLENTANWQDVGVDLHAALSAPLWLHEPSSTHFEFVPGGNRPDIKAVRQVKEAEVVLLAGEVKGRKDLSNVWESWIPQVAAHMESWSAGYPDAYCGVFMTVFTKEMISGKTPKGKEQRRGLKKLYQEGLLNFAINLSSLNTKDNAMCKQFKQLFRSVLGQKKKSNS
jgi:hypothetical protein